jgi:hypothetical protein
VVSLTSQPLYSGGKNPQYPVGSRLGGPQNWSGHCGEEKILDLIGTRTLTPQLSSSKPFAIPTSLSQFLNEDF